MEMNRFNIWRSSYDVATPALRPTDERFPGIEERYALLAKDSLPLTESLKTRWLV
ncbi:hypothetical protein [Duncaniella dubosii]|uniref:hypothetical protein n=1 Tax=Duncaniella dubosii TaxID=2518971 RepID=UPI003F6752EB